MAYSKTEQTKTGIEDAFIGLIAEKCWDKITVSEVCESMNISRGTFYRYFSDIYELAETVERELLDSLECAYRQIPRKGNFSHGTKINCESPRMLTEWFNFCRDNRVRISALLDSRNGDPYFKARLKGVLKKYTSMMMDEDGFPKDKFRTHFIKVFLELHFLATQTWLDCDDASFLSVDEIVIVLNTMRIGASYLAMSEASPSE